MAARPVWAMHGHYGNPPKFCSVFFPPWVVEIPQPPRLPCPLSHLRRCSWFSCWLVFAPGAPSMYMLTYMYSFMAVFGLQECIHPTWSTFISLAQLFLLFGVIYFSLLNPGVQFSAALFCFNLCSKIFFLYLSLIMFLMIKIRINTWKFQSVSVLQLFFVWTCLLPSCRDYNVGDWTGVGKLLLLQSCFKIHLELLS